MNKANECTCPSGDGSLVHPCPAHPAEQAEAERSALWAVHAQGPDELYAAFSREDAEKHAAELNALPMPEGIAVGAVVVPSPWPAVQHWQYLAEQEQDHKNEIAGRLRQLERICEGLPQDAIDGGWTVQGIRGYAKRLEDQLKAALARVAELESKLAELEKQEPIGWWAQYCETPMRRMVHWGAKGPECTSEEFHPFYAAPFVKAQHRVPGKYDEVLLPFLKSMEHEMHANAGKGDRPGWLQMDRRTALLEIYYHLAKLQKATKDNDPAGIVEYAADVANMSMMLVDVCGLLAAAPGNSAQHSVPGDIMRDAQRYRWLRDQQFYFSFSTENSDAGISSCTAGMSSRFKNLSWVDAAIDSAIAAAPGKEVGHE
ncbi:hypothetical protein ABMZ20_01090 [Pseudomonas aeruginosa]|uniref:hypothetical protein n=1 Tax=Pseudomonas aeruginosa TaxID=287 RepID=UPI0039BDF68C|nr:hypothetical protein [Pseudomonas aeruginosa]